MNDRQADEEGNGLQPDVAKPYSLPMEARVAVLEEIARNTEKLLAKMDARMDRMETHAIQMEERLNARIAETIQRMAEMETRLIAQIAAMEARVDKRMEAFETHLRRIEDRQTSDFRWMIGLGLGAVGFVFAIVAHGFHWF